MSERRTRGEARSRSRATWSPRSAAGRPERAGPAPDRPAHRAEIELAHPPGFRLDATVRGHGWYDLPPFAYDPDEGITIVHTINGQVFELLVKQPVSGMVALSVVTSEPPDDSIMTGAGGLARAVLSFDQDLEPFYRITDVDPTLSWARPAGAGRLLRAPTVFEDLVKLICTTNASWAATHRMVSALVNELGEPSATGRRAFPTPARMAAEPESFYRTVARAGYRSRALRELAVKSAREPAALERLRNVRWSSATLRRALLELHGVGPYVAEHLLRLLGRHDFLAIDSWCVAKYARLRNSRRRPTPHTLARAYARYGPYRGLAMWLDLTRDWPCYRGSTETWLG